MPWNPDIYNQFKDIRYQPFFDLMEMIQPENLHTAVDLGCGTGEQTSILAKRFDQCDFTGIDASQEMLKGSLVFANNNLNFKEATIEAFADDGTKWDLIFSNAALQWSDDHKNLFPKIISKLNAGGQWAVQLPHQKENLLNKILLQIVMEEPFAGFLKGYTHESPVRSLDEYAQIMFESGLRDLNISMRVYPIIAQSEEELYNFISGSALIPYMERLNHEQQGFLKNVFLQRIREAFISFPAIYAFKRLLLYGKMQD